jgi:arsenate reductase
LRDNGIEPKIIEYLKTPPSFNELEKISKLLDKRPSDFTRKGESEFKDNQLVDLIDKDQEMIYAMIKYPKIIERPIVVKGQKAVIGRPPENIMELL